jgi:hypothetical protein
MIKLIDLLNEGKQVGTLYHFTNLFSLIKILETNTFKGSNAWNKNEKPFVSFTRNKNGWGLVSGPGKTVRITIDGNKLSNNYKISPYDMQNLKRWEDTPLDEMEERVFGDINNAKNYIIEIVIQSKALESYPHLEDELKIIYPNYKILNKVTRRDKLVSSNEVELPLTDDVKQYIDNIITKEKIEYNSDFPKYEMIKYFNQKLNTKYDSLTHQIEEYIISKLKY